MDNCTRCGDRATTRVTINRAVEHYCNPCVRAAVIIAKGGDEIFVDRALTPEEERAIYEAHTSAADVLAGRGPMRLVGAASLVE